MIGTITSQEGVLKGSIKTDACVKGIIKTDISIKGCLSMPVGYEDYTGNYNILPEVKEQIIPTSNKHMTEDLTIQAIPFYKTTNPQGGETIIIGG